MCELSLPSPQKSLQVSNVVFWVNPVEADSSVHSSLEVAFLFTEYYFDNRMKKISHCRELQVSWMLDLTLSCPLWVSSRVVHSKPLGKLTSEWENPEELSRFHVHVSWVHFELIWASFKIQIDLLMAAWSKCIWSVIQLSKYSIADRVSFFRPCVQGGVPVWRLARFLTALLMLAFLFFQAFLISVGHSSITDSHWFSFFSF